MRKLLSWVHISDLHFGHGDPHHRWDQQAVLHALSEDVTSGVRHGAPAPDVIFVTGDVGYSGNSPKFTGTEYRDAEAWLSGVCKRLSVPPARVFIVPGNHDVDRAVDADRDIARMLDDYRNGTAVDNALASPGDFDKIAKRQAAYLAFAARFAPCCGDLGWRHAFDLDGSRIHIVGLNSALLAKDERDKGRLQVGRSVVTPALKQSDDDALTVVLSHHPLREGWMRDQDDIAGRVRRLAHVHLCGHVHSASSEDVRAGGGGAQMLTVIAGAAHGDQASPEVTTGHGYNFGAAYVAGGELLIRVWPRAFTKNNDFRVDPNGVPDGEVMAEHWLGSSSWRLGGATRKLRVTVSLDLELDPATQVGSLSQAVGRELWKKRPPVRATWTSNALGQDVALNDGDRLEDHAMKDGEALRLEAK